MADQTEKVLFEIRLDDEQYKQETKLIRESLVALVLDIDKTKAQQKQLNEQRKLGAITDAEYAKKAVELRQQLRAQQADQRELEKGLVTLDKVYNSAAGSIDQLKARSAELTTQYNAMAKAGRLNTEEGKALTAELGEVNAELLKGGQVVNDNRRNVGNYTASFKAGLEPLIVELAKVRAQMQGLDQSSEAFDGLKRRAIGFETAAIRAGAQAGLSFEQAEAKIKDYGAQIQPVVENLVRLEQEQEKIEEGSEAYRKIGFQIAALGKELEQAPADTKKLSTALVEAAGNTDLLGGSVQKATELQQGYTRAQELARIAMGTSTGAAKALRIALIATGLGAFLVLVGTLFAYFTQTAEGGKILETVLARIGATVDVLTDRIGNFGKAVAQFFSGDFEASAETARQSFAGIGDEIERETKLAGDLSKARQQLERDEINNIDTNKKLLNQVERLKNIRDNEFNSLQVRKKANEDAYKIELEREKTLADLAARRVEILRQEIERRGGMTKATNDQLKTFKEAQNELADIQEDAAGKQNELITNRYQLDKEGQDAAKERAKAAADAAKKREEEALKRRREAIQLELVALDQQLKATTEGSDEELAILEKKLAKQRQLELTAKDLTIGQKKIIDAKYEADRDALVVEQNRKRINLALQEEANNIAARLVAVKRGSDEELRLQQQVIEKQRQQQLAAISERASADDRAAQERLINAQAEAQQTDLIYQNRAGAVNAFYLQERNALEQARAQGLVTEQQYSDALFQQELGRLTAQLEVAKRYGQDTAEIEQQITELRIQNIDRVTAKDREAKLQQLNSAIAFGEQLGQLFADTMSETGAQLQDFAAKALVLILDTISKAVIAAQVKIITEALASPESVATFGVAGFVKAGLIIAGLTAATAGLKASLTKSTPKQFAEGGVVHGPSHAQGGIPMYHRSGRYVGEMEGEEIILTRNVYRTPALRAAASAINVAAGGKPFAQNLQQMVAIPRHYAEGGVVRYDPATMDPMRAGTNNVQVIQQPIDYDLLAAKLAPAFVAGVRALPPQTIEPTQFKRLAENERRTQLTSDN
ncbi:hypothetical protein MUN82_03900 [Hymenobacter aerilatus]|uniref:Uncharacterized protein n=1 Tax=Hymenobacter aerilatus TaxID=2932251 RepID=A0A8T9SVP0_9BACT|nr:hypothetical protein [Hymenobacter aerilatus]UOR06242.1 hypothetical protein MUN82_03900 [Hymenobacter aerilatus]